MQVKKMGNKKERKWEYLGIWKRKRMSLSWLWRKGWPWIDFSVWKENPVEFFLFWDCLFLDCMQCSQKVHPSKKLFLSSFIFCHCCSCALYADYDGTTNRREVNKTLLHWLFIFSWAVPFFLQFPHHRKKKQGSVKEKKKWSFLCMMHAYPLWVNINNIQEKEKWRWLLWWWWWWAWKIDDDTYGDTQPNQWTLLTLGD